MNSTKLPDISRNEPPPVHSPLDWVGMQGIDLPILLHEKDYHRVLPAKVDVQVNLPALHKKGIHMSRLYQILDGLGEQEALTPPRIQRMLQDMIASHEECESDKVRMSVHVDVLARRPALISEGLAGWKSYPLQVDARMLKGTFSLRMGVTVPYSSTCPCSAALVRQLVQQRFQETFQDHKQIDLGSVTTWLRSEATLATPHSQRSEAQISVDVDTEAEELGIIPLIHLVEESLGTPVQTAVKREDEQAFAALNGQNLMFVEDATRRLKKALSESYSNVDIHVNHMESLHAHDAVAWTSAP